MKFEEQALPEYIDPSGDSDNAGDVVTRKSTSGAAVQLLIGSHLIKSQSALQAPVGLSSGEGEYYSCVRTARLAVTPA